ncbi:hypothetical protein ACPUYX_05610 [Desulfosporosinus sp. SYSU MS00001]|uniref:hypothetical protein n=1 Tax=Desulfosporosinus sp. SYSU MS00001 TaxID=3416284 RepID=UPI003CEAD0AE
MNSDEKIEEIMSKLNAIDFKSEGIQYLEELKKEYLQQVEALGEKVQSIRKEYGRTFAKREVETVSGIVLPFEPKKSEELERESDEVRKELNSLRTRLSAIEKALEIQNSRHRKLIDQLK